MSDKYTDLLAKLAMIEANLNQAARLKRHYELTIGVLVAIVIGLLIGLRLYS